jgi:small subunit ribosomal protein S7
MPRRPLKKKTPLTPDPKFNSEVLAKFINYIMLDGKKDRARTLVYEALEIVAKEAKTDEPLQVFNEAIKNVGPMMEVRSRRVGGANYQVPREVKQNRRQALAFRWITDASRSTRKSQGKAFSAVLAAELLAASNNEGSAVKKKEETHRMAEANKAFAHFAW